MNLFPEGTQSGGQRTPTRRGRPRPGGAAVHHHPL